VTANPVLVTGATGFVGSHLVERLVACGIPVRCLVRKTSSLRYVRAGAVELFQGELATGEGLAAAVRGVETVFHVAGVTKAHTEAAYYDGNLRGTENLLRACERSDSPPRRFIHVSSLAAVGPSRTGSPLDEDAATCPLTWYGRSKLAAEDAVRASALASTAIILRPPVVYGPRDTDVFEVFRAVAKGVMVLIGREESWFSYIHVEDLAEALLAAAGLNRSGDTPGRPPEWQDSQRNAGVSPGFSGTPTYFVANPEPVSWTQFAEAAASVMGRRVRFLHAPVGAAYAAGWLAEMAAKLRGKPGILSRQKVIEATCRFWTCNPSRARSELGWCAGRTLREGIANSLAWYKDAGWLTF
jgi:nucleoside-diphosphate-sugar epimerase